MRGDIPPLPVRLHGVVLSYILYKHKAGDAGNTTREAAYSETQTSMGRGYSHSKQTGKGMEWNGT